MDTGLKGRVVLVTGASKGIGAAAGGCPGLRRS
jgi:NAD(P)-dependent dehydrogenase (short-subunit alcohol dehydrogenase family)